MKKLYLSGVEDRCGNVGNLKMWMMVMIGVMMFLNCCLLMSEATYPYITAKGEISYETPNWSILSLHLVPISMLVFYLFTTDDRFWNEEQDKKKERLRN